MMSPSHRIYSGQTPEQRRAERRGRMMAAGLELFGTVGYRATSIEQICAAAGVSTRNFYEEFRGREALLDAVHTRINTEANAEAKVAVQQLDKDDSDVPTTELLAIGVSTYIDHVCSDPRAARIVFVELLGVSPAMDERRLEVRNQHCRNTLRLCRRAVARGEAPDRDYSMAAVAYIGAFNQMVSEWALRGLDVPRATVIEEIVRFGRAALSLT